MDYLEVIRSFFNDSYKDISNKDKSSTYFMMNRRIAINHPVWAAFLSKTRISNLGVVDIWRFIFRKQYKVFPNWLWTKTTKVEIKDKKEKEIDKNLVINYCKLHKISNKEFEMLQEKFPKELIEELKTLKEFLI